MGCRALPSDSLPWKYGRSALSSWPAESPDVAAISLWCLGTATGVSPAPTNELLQRGSAQAGRPTAMSLLDLPEGSSEVGSSEVFHQLRWTGHSSPSQVE